MYEFLVLMNNDYIITNNECVSDMINFLIKIKKSFLYNVLIQKKTKKI